MNTVSTLMVAPEAAHPEETLLITISSKSRTRSRHWPSSPGRGAGRPAGADRRARATARHPAPVPGAAVRDASPRRPAAEPARGEGRLLFVRDPGEVTVLQGRAAARGRVRRRGGAAGSEGVWSKAVGACATCSAGRRSPSRAAGGPGRRRADVPHLKRPARQRAVSLCRAENAPLETARDRLNPVSTGPLLAHLERRRRGLPGRRTEAGQCLRPVPGLSLLNGNGREGRQSDP